MILADTSIWVDHLREGDAALAALLDANRICIHPFVVGEVALGHLKARKRVLELLLALPKLQAAGQDEILFFVERHRLMGRGIGLVDVHLLASVVLSGGVSLWTRDKRLGEVADGLGLGWVPAAN